MGINIINIQKGCGMNVATLKACSISLFDNKHNDDDCCLGDNDNNRLLDVIAIDDDDNADSDNAEFTNIINSNTNNIMIK